MRFSTDQVLKMVKEATPGWEKLVPENVAEMIKNKCLFGFPCVVYDAKAKRSSVLDLENG